MTSVCDPTKVQQNTASITSLQQKLDEVKKQLVDKSFQGSDSVVQTSENIISMSSDLNVNIIAILTNEASEDNPLNNIKNNPLYVVIPQKDPLVMQVNTLQKLIDNKNQIKNIVINSGYNMVKGNLTALSEDLQNLKEINSQNQSAGSTISKIYSSPDVDEALKKNYYSFGQVAIDLLTYVNNPGTLSVPTNDDKNPISNVLSKYTNAYIEADPITYDVANLSGLFGEGGKRRNKRNRKNKRGGNTQGVFAEGYEDRFANSYDVVKTNLQTLESTLYPENALDYNNLSNSLQAVQKYFKPEFLGNYTTCEQNAKILEQARCISVPGFYKETQDQNKPKNCKVENNPSNEGQNTLSNVGQKIQVLVNAVNSNKDNFTTLQLSPFNNEIKLLNDYQKDKDAEVLKNKTLVTTGFQKREKEEKQKIEDESKQALEKNESEWQATTKTLAKKQKNNTIQETEDKQDAIQRINDTIKSKFSLGDAEVQNLYKNFDKDSSGILGINELKDAFKQPAYVSKVKEILEGKGYEEPDGDDVSKYVNRTINVLENNITIAEVAEKNLFSANNDDETKGALGRFVLQKKEAESKYQLGKTKIIGEQTAKIADVNNRYSETNLNTLLDSVAKKTKELQNNPGNAELQQQIQLLINTGSESANVTEEQHKQLCVANKSHVYKGTTYKDLASCNLPPQPVAAAAGRRKSKRSQKKNINGNKRRTHKNRR